MANQFSITCVQGATLSVVVTFNQPDVGSSPGPPVNLTGYTAFMDVTDDNGAVIVQLNTTNGRIVLGGALGTLTLTLPATVTAALPSGVYKYDLFANSADSPPVITRLIYGSFVVMSRVTLNQ